MKPPPRMLEDATLPPELRATLERAVAVADPYDPLRGEAKLSAALALATEPLADSAAGVTSAHAGDAQLTAPSGLFGSTAAKLSVAAAMAAVVTAGVLALQERTAPRQPQASERRAVTLAPAAPRPADDRAPGIEQQQPQPADTPSATVQARGRGGAADADEALRREIAQVGRIKESLERNPALAYALAQAGHREFPRGMLREEREALAVLSLWNMGRNAEARRRAEAFLARYPNSSVRGQVERRLAAERQDGPAR